MKNILKNKLLIISVLFSIIITTMCSSVFADTEYSLHNQNGSLSEYRVVGFSPTFKNNEDSFVIYGYGYVGYFDSSQYYLVLSSSDSGTLFLKRKVDNALIDNTLRIERYNYIYDNENRSYNFSSISSESFGSGVLFSCIFTTQNIVNANGDVVFQGAPQEQEEITNPTQEEEITNPTNPEEEITSPVVQVELMKPTQVQEILPQIMAVVGIVLPTLLTIFGVLLVLYLIKSKNLLHL